MTDQTKATQAALLEKSQAARSDSQQHPRLFYALIGIVILVLGIGAAIFLSTPSASSANTADQSDPGPSPDVSYGQNQTPPPIRTTAPTPAPGITGQPTNGNADWSPSPAPQQNGNGGAAQPVATPMGPRLVTIYDANAPQQNTVPQQALDAGGAQTLGPSGDNLAQQAALLRSQILSMEAAHGIGPGTTTFASGGGANTGSTSFVPQTGGSAAYAPQQTGSTGGSAGASGGSNGYEGGSTGGAGDNGVMNTPFYQPEAYEVPMGSHVEAIIDGTTDSSLAGTIVAHIAKNKRDPRNGALIIPRGATLLGFYTGLTPGAGHLALTWTWLVYPDLCKRPLTRVTTADQEGSSGVPGHVDAHLWAQFRNTLVDSIVGSAGQIIASAVSRGGNLVGNFGAGGSIQTQPSQSADIPTLYAGRDTPFDLILQADYSAPHPYRGDGECSFQ